MATNLGSTGLSFNTANMKPASDEQIDSVWGQNIADNTSAAYWRYNDPRATVGTHIIGEMFVYGDLNLGAAALFDDYTDQYRFDSRFFFKKPEHTNLIGSFWGTAISDTNGFSRDGTFILTINGGTAQTWGTTVPDNTTVTFNESFSYDISGLTDNTLYEIKSDAIGFAVGISARTIANGKWLVMCS